MQIISKDENERSSSRRTNTIDTIIYVGRIGGYMKQELVGKFLLGLRKEFGEGDKESVKVAECYKLKTLELIKRRNLV